MGRDSGETAVMTGPGWDLLYKLESSACHRDGAPLVDSITGNYLGFVLPSKSVELIIGRLRLEIFLESRI